MIAVMYEYITCIAVWCLILNTYIVFTANRVNTMVEGRKKGLQNVIYLLSMLLLIMDLHTFLFTGHDNRWAYWIMRIAVYTMYLLKYLYITAFTLLLMRVSKEFGRTKKVLLAISCLIGLTGMICLSTPGIREQFCYFDGNNNLNYGRIYGIIRFLFVLDILVLLIALLLERRHYRKKSFYLYLGYGLNILFMGVLDYLMDARYLQNMVIFFSTMIIFIDNMTNVSEDWITTKRELLVAEYEASHDLMTGMWNKTSGLERIKQCLKNMAEDDAAVMGFVDIDNFKKVNDTYGHENGDFWIREVAALLQEICDPEDIVCRYGGDEYIIFLKDIRNTDELTVRMENFRKSLHEKAVQKEHEVHCSLGLYMVEGAGKTLAECVIMADGLLYQAKKNGKDTYVIG